MPSQRNNELLRPVLDYINTLALLKETAKSEAKTYLYGVISPNAKKIAKLMVSELKKNDGKLHQFLQKNVVIPIMQIARKYQDGAMQASSEYAKSVISEIKKSHIKKSFWDWLEEVAKAEKQIEKDARAVMANRLENATTNYELQTKSLLSDLFLMGSGKAGEERIASELATGKREAGTYFNASTESAGSYLWQVADMAADEAFQAENIERLKWVTFFSHSCPDCEDLHGKVKTYERWLWHGLPRSGVTVCRSHCHCVLVPVEYPVEIAKPMSLASGREILQQISSVKPTKRGANAANAKPKQNRAVDDDLVEDEEEE